MTDTNVQSANLHEKLRLSESDINFKNYFHSISPVHLPKDTQDSKELERIRQIQKTNLEAITNQVEEKKKETEEIESGIKEALPLEKNFFESEKKEAAAKLNYHKERAKIKQLNQKFPLCADFSFLWRNTQKVKKPISHRPELYVLAPQVAMYNMNNNERSLEIEVYKRNTFPSHEEKSTTAEDKINNMIRKHLRNKIDEYAHEVTRIEINTHFRGKLSEEQKTKLNMWQNEFESVHLLARAYWQESNEKNKQAIPVGLLNTTYHGVIGFALDVFDV